MLNRPGELVANVAAPNDLYVPKSLHDLEKLLPYLEQHNPELKIAKAAAEAMQQGLDSERSRYWPTLDSQFEMHEYERDLPNRDKMRLAITLNIPLWQGDGVSGAVAAANAKWREQNAHYQLRQMEVAQEFVEAWQAFNVLRIKQEEMLALVDYRDLKLDEARALYEMEVQTTLGRSMVDISDATLQLNKAKYQLVLHWLELQAMLGEPARLKQSEGLSVADAANSTFDVTNADESSNTQVTQEVGKDEKQ